MMYSVNLCMLVFQNIFWSKIDQCSVYLAGSMTLAKPIVADFVFLFSRTFSYTFSIYKVHALHGHIKSQSIMIILGKMGACMKS